MPRVLRVKRPDGSLVRVAVPDGISDDDAGVLLYDRREELGMPGMPPPRGALVAPTAGQRFLADTFGDLSPGIHTPKADADGVLRFPSKTRMIGEALLGATNTVKGRNGLLGPQSTPQAKADHALGAVAQLDQTATAMDTQEATARAQAWDARQARLNQGFLPEARQAQPPSLSERADMGILRLLNYTINPEANPIARNVATGAVQATGDIGSMAARALGALSNEDMGALADDVVRTSDANEQLYSGFDEKSGSPFWNRSIRGASRSLSTAIPAGVVAGPYAAISMAMLTEGNRAVTGGKDADLEGGKLAAYVAGKTVWEGIPATIMQRMGLGGLEDVFKNKASSDAVREIVGRGFLDAAKRLGVKMTQEQIEEQITEFGHLVGDKLAGVNPDALTGKSIYETALATAGQTLIATSAVHTPSLVRGGVESTTDAARALQSREDARNAERDARDAAIIEQRGEQTAKAERVQVQTANEAARREGRANVEAGLTPEVEARAPESQEDFDARMRQFEERKQRAKDRRRLLNRAKEAATVKGEARAEDAEIDRLIAEEERQLADEDAEIERLIAEEDAARLRRHAQADALLEAGRTHAPSPLKAELSSTVTREQLEARRKEEQAARFVPMEDGSPDVGMVDENKRLLWDGAQTRQSPERPPSAISGQGSTGIVPQVDAAVEAQADADEAAGIDLDGRIGVADELAQKLPEDANPDEYFTNGEPNAKAFEFLAQWDRENRIGEASPGRAAPQASLPAPPEGETRQQTTALSAQAQEFVDRAGSMDEALRRLDQDHGRTARKMRKELQAAQPPLEKLRRFLRGEASGTEVLGLGPVREEVRSALNQTASVPVEADTPIVIAADEVRHIVNRHELGEDAAERILATIESPTHVASTGKNRQRIWLLRQNGGDRLSVAVYGKRKGEIRLRTYYEEDADRIFKDLKQKGVPLVAVAKSVVTPPSPKTGSNPGSQPGLIGTSTTPFSEQGTTEAPEAQGRESDALEARPVDESGQVHIPMPATMTDPADADRLPVQKIKPILARMSRLAGLPIRVGRIGARGSRSTQGIYFPSEHLARLKTANDIPTAAHEFAHGLETVHRQANGNISRDDWINAMPPPVQRELASLDYDPAKARVFEGFAEFTRMYLTNMPTNAPAAGAWFQETFVQRNKKLGRGLDRLRAQIAKYQGQGPFNRMAAQLDLPEDRNKWHERWEKTKQFPSLLMSRFYDSGRAVLRMEKAGNQGQLATGESSPYKTLQRVSGASSAKAANWVENGPTDFAGNQTGPALREALKGVAGDERAAIVYAYARHAVETWAKGINPGSTLADAQAVVANWETPERRAFSDALKAYSDQMILYLADAGGISVQDAAQIMAAWNFYVPLKRVFDSSEFQSAPGPGGDRIGDTGSPMKSLRGSGRVVVDPIVALMQYTEQIINVADKTRMARSLVKYAQDKGGMGEWMTEVPPDKVRTLFQLGSIEEQLKALGVEIPEGTQTDALLSLYSNSHMTPMPGNFVAFVVDGKRRFYELHPDLYAGLQGIDALKLPAVIDMTAGAVARTVRMGATGLRGSFSLANAIIDAVTFLLQSEHNPFQAAGYLTKTYLQGFAPQVFGESEAGRLWRAGGGQLDNLMGGDKRSIDAARNRLMANTRLRKLNRIVSIDTLRDILSVTESLPRIAEFEMTARKHGWRPGQPMTNDQAIEASFAAGEVSLPFRKAGTWGRRINQVAAFFNATIRAQGRFIESHKNHPLRSFTRGAAMITLPAIYNWWSYKDDEEWRDLSPWLKYGFLNLKIHGELFRIPMPSQWYFAYAAMPVAVLDAIYRDKPVAFSDLARHAINREMPPLVPNIVSAPAGALANYDWFREDKIVPTHQENLPAELQSRPWTTETAKIVGENIGVAPAKLEYFANGWSGGMFSALFGATESGMGFGREIKEPADFPLVGRFFVRDSTSMSVDKVYEDLRELESSHSAYTLLRKDDPERAEKYKLSSEDTTRMRGLARAKKTLDGLREGYYKAETREQRQGIMDRMRTTAMKAVGD